MYQIQHTRQGCQNPLGRYVRKHVTNICLLYLPTGGIYG